MKTAKFLFIGALGLVMLSACSKTEKSQEQTAVSVEVYTPNVKKTGSFSLSGEITASKTAYISTRMMGYIEKIYVKPGDRVGAGQLLVSISSGDVQAKKAQVQAMINEAEAAAANSAKDLQRFTILHQQNSVSDKELENITLFNTSMQSKVQMAREQLKEVEVMLSYTHIRAPFAGVITQKMAEQGSMANPGMPILLMEQKGDLQVVASVSEAYVRQLAVGDKALIALKSQNLVLDGKIIELSPSAAATGGQYMLKLSVDTKGNASVQPGMYVNVQFEKPIAEDAASFNQVLVPTKAIVYRDQLSGVYVVNDQNQAILRWVRLGKVVGDEVEVVSGLSADEQVVLSSEAKLYNGVVVSITNS